MLSTLKPELQHVFGDFICWEFHQAMPAISNRKILYEYVLFESDFPVRICWHCLVKFPAIEIAKTCCDSGISVAKIGGKCEYPAGYTP